MNNITNPIHTQCHVSSNPANIGQAEVNSAVAQVQYSSAMPNAIPAQGHMPVKKVDSALTAAENSRLAQIKERSAPPFIHQEDELRKAMGDFDPFADYFHQLEDLTKATADFNPSQAFLNSAYYLMSQKVDLGYGYRMEAAEKITNEAIKQTVLDALKKEFGA